MSIIALILDDKRGFVYNGYKMEGNAEHYR